MKKIAVLLMSLLAFSSAKADDLSVIAHGISKHLENHNYNERNYGGGLRYENSEYGIQVGKYENSFRRETIYAGADWSPIHFNVHKCFNFQSGVYAGVATGYKYNVTPMAGVQAAVRCKDVFLRLRVMPDIYYNTKAVGAIEIGLVLKRF